MTDQQPCHKSIGLAKHIWLGYYSLGEPTLPKNVADLSSAKQDALQTVKDLSYEVISVYIALIMIRIIRTTRVIVILRINIGSICSGIDSGDSKLVTT